MRTEVRFEAILGDMMARCDSRDWRGMVDGFVGVIAISMTRVASRSLAKSRFYTRDLGHSVALENAVYFVDSPVSLSQVRNGLK